MAELRTLARPYAKAVYEYALAAGDLDQWAGTLDLLSAVVAEEKVARLLASPDLTVQQQAAAVVDLCADAIDDKARNLVHLLAENRRLTLLPFIAEQYRALKTREERAVDVELVSASQLDEGQQESFTRALSQRLERTVRLSVSVDKSLIGGVLIRAGDTIIDASIRGRLNKLAEALNT